MITNPEGSMHTKTKPWYVLDGVAMPAALAHSYLQTQGEYTSELEDSAHFTACFFEASDQQKKHARFLLACFAFKRFLPRHVNGWFRQHHIQDPPLPEPLAFLQEHTPGGLAGPALSDKQIKKLAESLRQHAQNSPGTLNQDLSALSCRLLNSDMRALATQLQIPLTLRDKREQVLTAIGEKLQSEITQHSIDMQAQRILQSLQESPSHLLHACVNAHPTITRQICQQALLTIPGHAENQAKRLLFEAREISRAHQAWSARSRSLGILPRALHREVSRYLRHSKILAARSQQLCRDARQLWQEKHHTDLKRSHQAFNGGTVEDLPDLFWIGKMLVRDYPDILPEHNSQQTLYTLLAAGGIPPASSQEAYESCLAILGKTGTHALSLTRHPHGETLQEGSVSPLILQKVPTLQPDQLAILLSCSEQDPEEVADVLLLPTNPPDTELPALLADTDLTQSRPSALSRAQAYGKRILQEKLWPSPDAESGPLLTPSKQTT
jgi:hypothetical protein